MPLSKNTSPTNALEDMREPHDKRVLTSRLGRAIEGAGYIDLLLAAVGILLLGTFYYHWIPAGNGLAINSIAICPDFFQALYFCTVTFTTLGYGDLLPIGTGRLVAGLIVVSGLTLTALLIGKFASERQQSTLFLLYTSDAQRRLEDFVGRIKDLRNQLEKSVSSSGSTGSFSGALQSLENLLEATFSYAIFNANQARLMEFGNASALKSLYGELASVQKTCASIHKLPVDDVAASDCALNLTRRLSNVMKVMMGFHRQKPGSYASMIIKKFRSALLLSCLQLLRPMYAWVKPLSTPKGSNALKVKQRLQKLIHILESHLRPIDTGVHIEICKNMNLVTSDLNYWVQRTATPAMLLKVLKLVPAGQPQKWSKDLNCQIGGKLKITNALARLCIEILRQQGKLPKI